MLYYGSKLSPNIKVREPEGYLYCLNVPIARTGKQPYLRRELGLDGEGVVQVIRTPEEVFNRAAIASFESMPVCDDHPYSDVDSGNITAFGKGHVQNVRRGSPPEDDLLFADLIITHQDLIDEVLAGKREVSCGYNCDYVLADDGNVYQKAIRGNHVAVVKNGRAGDRVAIRDAAPEINERRQTPMPNTKKPSLLARAVAKFVRDSEPDEGAQAIDEMLETGDEFPIPAAPEAPKQDAAPVVPAAAPAVPVPAAPAAPAAPAVPKPKDDLPGADINQEILGLLKEIKAALVKPEPEPLDELEKELAAPANDSEEPPVVPAEQLQDEEPEEVKEPEETQDEDPEEEQPTEDCGSSGAVAHDTNAALLSVLKDMRKTVASLPEAQRKKVSDSMTAAMRKAAGLTPESKSANAKKLAAIASGKKAKDSAPVEDDGSELGRQLMAKYNPHYRK